MQAGQLVQATAEKDGQLGQHPRSPTPHLVTRSRKPTVGPSSLRMRGHLGSGGRLPARRRLVQVGVQLATAEKEGSGRADITQGWGSTRTCPLSWALHRCALDIRKRCSRMRARVCPAHRESPCVCAPDWSCARAAARPRPHHRLNPLNRNDLHGQPATLAL